MHLKRSHAATRHSPSRASSRSSPRLPDGVVLYVFDRNAAGYEAQMHSLGYSVLEVLLGLLRDELDAPAGTLDILDLGCGSGWCGPLLRPFARRIVGVDLAPRMLAIARDKHVYDQRVEAELVSYLATTPERFHAIVAANVLIHFGDLGTLAQGAARVLLPGGGFIFDVEKGDGIEPGFHVSGRYTHSRGLLEHTLPPCGLALGRSEDTVMRTERGAPVSALCCAARKT
jgi:predicted TPR repeat methyltransferase